MIGGIGFIALSRLVKGFILASTGVSLIGQFFHHTLPVSIRRVVNPFLLVPVTEDHIAKNLKTLPCSHRTGVGFSKHPL